MERFIGCATHAITTGSAGGLQNRCDFPSETRPQTPQVLIYQNCRYRSGWAQLFRASVSHLAGLSKASPPLRPSTRQRTLDPFLVHIKIVVANPADHLRQDLLVLVVDSGRKVPTVGPDYPCSERLWMETSPLGNLMTAPQFRKVWPVDSVFSLVSST